MVQGVEVDETVKLSLEVKVVRIVELMMGRRERVEDRNPADIYLLSEGQYTI